MDHPDPQSVMEGTKSQTNKNKSNNVKGSSSKTMQSRDLDEAQSKERFLDAPGALYRLFSQLIIK